MSTPVAASKPLLSQLSRRERQIMDAVYQEGEATVSDVVRLMPDAPAYNTIRVTLSILEKKGYLTHRREGQRYVYRPVVPRDRATHSALRHMLRTFFAGSPSKAILALLGMSADRLSEEDLDEIAAQIERARQPSN